MTTPDGLILPLSFTHRILVIISGVESSQKSYLSNNNQHKHVNMAQILIYGTKSGFSGETGGDERFAAVKVESVCFHPVSR